MDGNKNIYDNKIKENENIIINLKNELNKLKAKLFDEKIIY